jgi:hypothetical protein
MPHARSSLERVLGAQVNPTVGPERVREALRDEPVVAVVGTRVDIEDRDREVLVAGEFAGWSSRTAGARGLRGRRAVGAG